MRVALTSISIALLASAITISPLAWSQNTVARPDAVTPTGAAARMALSLDQALTLTRESSPSLSAARYDAASRDGLLQQAGARPNPSLDIAMEDRRAASRKTTTSLSLPLELGGKRSARIAAARLDRDIAQQTYTQTWAQLRASVIAGYFKVAIAQQAVAVSRTALDIAQQALGLAERRVSAGKAAPLEANRAQVQQASARLALRSAELDLDAARRALSLLWGAATPDFETVSELPAELPARESLDTLRAALAQSPALQASRLAVELGQARLNVEKSRRYPDITLTAGVQRDNEAGRNIAQIGVGIPLPIYDRNQGNVYAATMQSYQAQDQHRADLARYEADLLQAVAQFDLASVSVRDYRDTVLPNATQAYQSARKGYEAGKTGFLDVLDAQRSLSQANIDYLNVLARAYQASADIDRIVGR